MLLLLKNNPFTEKLIQGFFEFFLKIAIYQVSGVSCRQEVSSPWDPISPGSSRRSSEVGTQQQQQLSSHQQLNNSHAAAQQQQQLMGGGASRLESLRGEGNIE